MVSDAAQNVGGELVPQAVAKPSSAYITSLWHMKPDLEEQHGNSGKTQINPFNKIYQQTNLAEQWSWASAPHEQDPGGECNHWKPKVGNVIMEWNVRGENER
jgi:hypothetical protein